MAQKNPFGKTYTTAGVNSGPTTIPSVGPGNYTGKPKKQKKRRKKKKETPKKIEKTYFDFLMGN